MKLGGLNRVSFLEPPMPCVVGIDHLVLSVSDLARSMYKSRPKQKQRKAWARPTPCRLMRPDR